jgi:uncharacterized protein (TIGR02302 family)
MTDPQDDIPLTLPRRVYRLRVWTYLSLLLERLTYSFLPLFTWSFFFAGLWLSGLLIAQNENIHFALSLIFFIGWLALFIRGARSVRLPRADETDRRLQEQSGVAHRPLDDIYDTLSRDGGITTRTLWGKSRAALPGALARLKFAPPRPVMALADPAALRIGALIFFIAGLVMAGHAAPARFITGLWPYHFSPTGLIKTDVATITITPPAYTGRDTIVLSGISKDDQPPLDIPDGSTISARVTGGFGTPTVRMNETHLVMNALDRHSFTIETPLVAGTEISIHQLFGARLRWPYRLVADTGPSMRQDGDIVIMPRGDIRVPLILSDDYGVRDLQMRLDIDPSVIKRPMGEFYDEIRAVMTAGGKDVKIQPVYNLSFHPWAGLPVRLSFLATDAKGQAAILPSIPLTLPERVFHDPVAAKLIEMRKTIAWNPDADRLPMERVLISLVNNPQSYRGDMTVHLGLSSALYRLAYSPGIETAKAMIPLLWDIAVRIEEGDTGRALRDMQDIREKLEAALDNPEATDEEIAMLTSQLQEAMQRYLQEMARTMQRRMQDGSAPPLIPPEMFGQMINQQDLEMFFAQLQAQALSGDKDAAREMLSRLSQMMDMMDPSMNAQMPEDMQMMAESMNRLRELVDRQQTLIDETQAAQQEEAKDYTPQHRAQESIRHDLGDLMQDAAEKLPAVPENMGQAEQQMRLAAKALTDGDADAAMAYQQEALRLLNQSKQDMAQQLTQRLSQMTGMAMGGGGMKMDPLGRPYGQGNSTNPLLGEKVKVPDESDRKKIEEILQTLRKKSGELSRPPEELDYYRRLLKQF